MDTQRSERVSELVSAALARRADERAAYLDRACGSDCELKAEVESLLSAHGTAPTEGLTNPQAWGADAVHDESAVDPVIGQRIGSYEILKRLGSGGMGTVYMAARVDDYEQIVAIKLVKHGMDSGDFVRRFKTEMQVMASLGEHPNIARLLDAGTVEDGLPYFVMEYVEGTWINQHCDGHKLSIRDRLLLFRAACAAVQFAHRHAVIHRDLKPSNMLISEQGVPKLIDFGIAKLLPAAGAAATVVRTLPEYRVLTPRYASPEQMRGEAVSTASDVYSLGVVLYELLTGSRPYELTERNEVQWLQVVCEEQPKKPSTVVRKTVAGDSVDRAGKAAGSESVAAARGESPRQLHRHLRGDIDNIVLMALRKEPERRYESVEQFAADIDLHLAGRPVRARRDTFAYRSAKFMKRNKLAAAIMALLFFSVVGGVSGIVWQWRNTIAAQRGRIAAQTNGLLSASPDAIPVIIDNLRPYSDQVEPRLRALLADDSQSDAARLRISLALVESDPAQVGYLSGRLLDAEPDELAIIREALLPFRADLTGSLWTTLQDATTPSSQRLRAASALALFDPDAAHWSDLSTAIADALAAESPFIVGQWSTLLRPAREQLSAPLSIIFRDTNRTETQRLVATRVLADYAANRPRRLAALLMDAEPPQFQLLFAALAGDPDPAIALFESELDVAPPAKASEAAKDALAGRQANAAVALLMLGHGQRVWPLFAHRPDPRLRSFLIHRLVGSGVDRQLLVERFRVEPDVSIRRALLLGLGEYDPQLVLSGQDDSFADELLAAYRDDPDPGMHAAAGWLLQRWNQPRRAAAVDSGPTADRQPSARQWYRHGDGQTMVVLEGPVEFQMGTGRGEPGRHLDEFQHRQTIDHRFAIAATEVTVEQFGRFLKDHPGMTEPFLRRYAPEPDSAQVLVTWYEAAKYCRWLSQREGIAADDMCYPPVDEIKNGMRPEKDYLTKSGYRLPLEAEWEYACRAGATTPRYYGNSEELLDQYAWFLRNAKDHTWPVGMLKPNDFGLFDMHGNAWEWCQEEYTTFAVAAPREMTDLKPLDDQGGRMLRGGSYGDSPILVRSGDRNMYRPNSSLIVFGFRVARSMPSQ